MPVDLFQPAINLIEPCVHKLEFFLTHRAVCLDRRNAQFERRQPPFLVAQELLRALLRRQLRVGDIIAAQAHASALNDGKPSSVRFSSCVRKSAFDTRVHWASRSAERAGT